MKHWVKRHNKFIWFGLLLVIILCPNFYVISNQIEYLYISHLKKVLFVLFSILIFLLPLLLIKVRMYFLAASPLVLLAPFEFFYRIRFGTESSVGIIGTVLDTNINEMLEFIEGQTFLLIIPVAAFLLYMWIVINRIEKEMRFNGKYKARFLSLVIIFLGILAVRDMVVARENSASAAYDSFMVRLNKTYPYGTLSKIASAFHEKNNVITYQQNIKDFAFNAVKKDNLKNREIYILIIGEAARYSNWGINGYYRNTSPTLSGINNLISYSDFISSSTMTKTSVPMMITRATAETFDLSYKEKSLLSPFKESGFKVYWISRQAKYSEHDTSITIHAMEADETIFISSETRSDNQYDEQLLPVLDGILDKDEDKLLIVLHTLGSHYKYSYRYPEQFDVFKPSLKGKRHVYIDDAEKKVLLVNSYDNSILYTDFFISSVVNRVQEIDSVSSVIYTSDHGECLFDDERNYFRHANPKPSRYEVHIPMFVWLSGRYIATYPDKSQNIINNRDKKLSSENLFYSLLDMGNIGYVGEDLTKSFASGKLVEAGRKLLTISNDVVEYNSKF